jgi:hypothetical protein
LQQDRIAAGSGNGKTVLIKRFPLDFFLLSNLYHPLQWYGSYSRSISTSISTLRLWRCALLFISLSWRRTASSMINVPKTSYMNTTQMSRASAQMRAQWRDVLSSISGLWRISYSEITRDFMKTLQLFRSLQRRIIVPHESERKKYVIRKKWKMLLLYVFDFLSFF